MAKDAHVDEGKARFIEMVQEWRQRSGLSVRDVMARLESTEIGISMSKFEYYFTTHAANPVSASPALTIGVVTAFTHSLLPSERCTAVEALEFARLARLPFDWLPELAGLFPDDEFAEAYEPYSPLGRRRHRT